MCLMGDSYVPRTSNEHRNGGTLVSATICFSCNAASSHIVGCHMTMLCSGNVLALNA